jgi:hypothetical protein
MHYTLRTKIAAPMMGKPRVLRKGGLVNWPPAGFFEIVELF